MLCVEERMCICFVHFSYMCLPSSAHGLHRHYGDLHCRHDHSAAVARWLQEHFFKGTSLTGLDVCFGFYLYLHTCQTLSQHVQSQILRQCSQRRRRQRLDCQVGLLTHGPYCYGDSNFCGVQKIVTETAKITAKHALR